MAGQMEREMGELMGELNNGRIGRRGVLRKTDVLIALRYYRGLARTSRVVDQDV